MRLVQLLDTFAYGDAIGNNAQAIGDLARSWGWESHIVARSIDPRVANIGVKAESFAFGDSPDNITLFHHSIGTSLVSRLKRLPGRKVMVYHNVTPSKYFAGVNPVLERLAAEGRRQLGTLKTLVEATISDSTFNMAELEALGFTNNRVIPILLDLKRRDETQADPGVVRLFEDGRTNWLFVGRLAVNKCQDDVMRVFAHYHHAIDPESRLILVGHGAGVESYAARLRTLAMQLGISRAVVFTWHVTDEQLVAYYKTAHIFVCMSEHEGFCVPLIEAMHFGLPVLAYAAGSIPETLGGSGILVRAKDPAILAETAHAVLEDETLKVKIINRQRERLARLEPAVVSQLWREALSALATEPLSAPSGSAPA